MADIATCAVCLDYLEEPVSIPCGHLHCRDCLHDHIESTDDALHSTCPTCRTPFSLVTPDKDALPRRLAHFVTPTIRRVYLDTAPLAAQARELAVLSRQVEDLTRQVQGLNLQIEDLSQEAQDLKHNAALHGRSVRALQSQHLEHTTELGRKLKSERGLVKRLQEGLARERRCADDEYEERTRLERCLDAAKKGAAEALERESNLAWMLEEKEVAFERLETELHEEREANKRSCAKWKARCDDLHREHKEHQRAYVEELDALRAQVNDRSRTPPAVPEGNHLSSYPDDLSALRQSLSRVLPALPAPSPLHEHQPELDGKEYASSPHMERQIRPLPRRVYFPNVRGTVRRERDDEAVDLALHKRSRVGSLDLSSALEILGPVSVPSSPLRLSTSTLRASLSQKPDFIQRSSNDGREQGMQ